MNLNIGRDSAKSIENAFGKLILELRKYVDTSLLTRDIKPLLFPNSFYQDNDQLLYPLLFGNFYHNHKDRNFIKKISIAGYLYFMHLLYVDKLNDKDEIDDEVPDELKLLRSVVYHEESLKLLFSMFPHNHKFWTYWSLRTNEFLQGIMIDKQLQSKADINWYKKLCIYKCTFLKTPIDTFYAISPTANNKQSHSELTKAIEYYSIARCMQDDFEDFKKDLIFKKNNWGITQLQKWLEKNQIACNSSDSVLLEKYFYASGVAESLLLESMLYYNKSIDVFKKYSLKLLVERTNSFRNKCNLTIVNIEAYKEIKFAKLNTSDKLVKINNFDNAIEKGLAFIYSNQKQQGSWVEISNKQGVSNVWATAFIAMHIPQSNYRYKAKQFLSKNKQGQFWGYNKSWVYDFDSTNCVLSVLRSADVSVYSNFFLHGQNKDGGIATYNKNPDLADLLGISDFSMIKGWTQSHVCVSAMTLYMLCITGKYKVIPKESSKLLTYILKHISKDNLWESYWWTSRIYPSTLIIKSLILIDLEKYWEQITNSIYSLLQLKNKRGLFDCDTLKESSIFYTAMVLDCLCTHKTVFKQYKVVINQIKDTIINSQYENGSFKSPYFLKIPNANIINPLLVKEWSVNLAGGHNVITGEFNHLFSTAVVVNALNNYKKCNGK